MKLYCIGLDTHGRQVLLNDDLTHVKGYFERIMRHDHDVMVLVFKRCREEDFYKAPAESIYYRDGKEFTLAKSNLSIT